MGEAVGLVLLATTPRVAPGLLNWPAWAALRAAGTVLVGAPDHPQLAALDQAGIGWQVAPAEPAADRARRLIDLIGPPGPPGAAHLGGDRAGPAGPAGPASRAGSASPDASGALVVWLCAQAGEAELMAELVAAGCAAQLLPGSVDLPGSRLLDLVATMDVLRTRCPWDAKQTHLSLAPHLLEESYEALDALEAGDAGALREELGDVLLQVVFHARVAAERGDDTSFDIDGVADAVVGKLVRRHPHVFGTVEVSGADEVITNWDAIKAAERAAKHGGPGSVLDGVPFGQPALSLAAQLQRRAERAGMPVRPGRSPAPDRPAAAGLRPESSTGPESGSGSADELGDRLFALVAVARAADLDPELELRAAARRFQVRVHAWEQAGAPGSPGASD
jgi:XTP/dITP diphosphohydrolase